MVRAGHENGTEGSEVRRGHSKKAKVGAGNQEPTRPQDKQASDIDRLAILPDWRHLPVRQLSWQSELTENTYKLHTKVWRNISQFPRYLVTWSM
jgi:hypothetical protein